MAAVADALGQVRGREGDPQLGPLRQRHHTDRLPHQHAPVGRRHRVERADRDLELAGRVLGMDLVDVHALRRERRQQVGGVVAQLHLPDRAVRGAGHRRDEFLAGRRAEPDGPLDLDGRLEGEAAPFGGVRDDPAQKGPGAAGVPLALLGDPVHGRPCPAGLPGQHHQLVEVGVEPEVAVGGAEDVGGDDRVVGQEGVEHRRHADPPGHGRLQPGRGNRLDPADARRVDVRQDDPVHPLGGQVHGEGGDPAQVAGAPAGHGVGKGGHASSSTGSAPGPGRGRARGGGVRVSRPPRRTAVPRRHPARRATASTAPAPARPAPDRRGTRRSRRGPER